MADVPPEVVAEIRRITADLMDRCDAEGIAWADLLVAVEKERALDPTCSVPVLYDRAYRRAKQNIN